MKLKRFNNLNENLDDEELDKIGFLLEETFKNYDGYFDFDHIDDENEVDYFFYFNKLDAFGMINICNDIKNNPNYDVQIIGGRHDNYEPDYGSPYQICFKITIDVEKIKELI